MQRDPHGPPSPTFEADDFDVDNDTLLESDVATDDDAPEDGLEANSGAERDVDGSDDDVDGSDDDVDGSDESDDEVDGSDDEVDGSDDDSDGSDDDSDGSDDVDDGEPPLRRGPLGAWLVGMGGGAWLFFAAMRCSPPIGGPELALDDLPTLDDADPEDSASTPEGDATRDPAAPESALGEELTADPAATRPTSDVDAPPPEEPDVIEAVPARPKPAPWASDIEPPTTVTYTVQRGGAMKNVANLFKIYHHEITALNPGVDLDRDLAPATKIVVYRAEAGERSESVGLPSAGSLEGAVPMMGGPGRILKMIPWKSWGTGMTVATLDRVLDQWAKRGSPQPILVGNLSSRHGGRLEPHSTHQSGRDVDLSYPQKMRPSEELNWREMTADNLDPAETWALMFLLVQSGAVEMMFIDRSLQKLLYEYAIERRLMSKRQLEDWLEYPRPTGSGDPVVQHVSGHVDHLHVRFKCQKHESRCESRGH